MSRILTQLPLNAPLVSVSSRRPMTRRYPFVAGTTFPAVPDQLIRRANRMKAPIPTSDKSQVIKHEEGVRCEMSFLLTGADNGTAGIRCYGIEPIYGEGIEDELVLRRRLFFDITVTASTEVGTEATSTLISTLMRSADTIAVNSDRCTPVGSTGLKLIIPRDGTGAPIAADNRAVGVEFDCRGFPWLEVIHGPLAADATGSAVCVRFF